MVTREVLWSIDRIERRACFALAAFILFISGYFVYAAEFIKTEHSTLTTTLSKAGTCTAPYVKNAAATLCEEATTSSLHALAFWGLVYAIGALALGLFAWWYRRVGTAFTALLVGLMLGPFSVGLPVVLLGGWLVWRGWRLHKYGVATFSGVAKVKRGQVEARREGRPPPEPPTPELPPAKPTRRSRAEKPSDPLDAPRKPAPPSKRYTPKKRARAKSR
jgi:MFS family permease